MHLLPYIGLTINLLRILSLGGIDKIRNHLVAIPIFIPNCFRQPAKIVRHLGKYLLVQMNETVSTKNKMKCPKGLFGSA